MASTAPPTDVVARTLRPLASRREILAAPPSATQMDCAATTTDDGRVPNSISVSLLVVGSMRINRLADSLTSQTASALAAIALGGLWRLIVAVTVADPGSIRETVPPTALATQTAPAPTAIPSGPSPTGMVAVTVSVLESTRKTRSSFLSATQTAPFQYAHPSRPLARRIGVCHSCDFGSNRRSDSSPNAVLTQTPSGLTATPIGGASP